MAEPTDFLDEMPTAVGEEQEQEQATPEPEPAPETGEAAPEAPPAPEPPKEDAGLYQAMKAEREKRQDAQRRAEELERKLKELETQQPKPEFYEDPNGFVQHYVQQTEQRFQQRLFAALESDVRAQHEDYDEAIEYLKSKGNPAMVQQVFQSANPAREAYNLAKRMQAFEEMGDPDSYRKKVEAEVRQKLEAELLAKDKAKQDAIARIPPDLTNGRSGAAPAVPTPPNDFSDLFPKR